MANENLPIRFTQITNLGPATQKIGLANQLFGDSNSADTFGRMLAQQVSNRDSARSDRPAHEPRSAVREANSGADSGKSLPKQRADQADRDNRANQSQERGRAEDSRAERPSASQQAAGSETSARKVDGRDVEEPVQSQASENSTSDQDTSVSEGQSEVANKEPAETSEQGKDTLTEEQQAALEQAAAEELVTTSPDSEVASDGAVGENLEGDDVEQAEPVASGDILVSPELLEKALQSQAQSEDGEIDEAFLAQLSEEERLALAAILNAPADIDGAGFEGLEVSDDAKAMLASMLAASTTTGSKAGSSEAPVKAGPADALLANSNVSSATVASDQGKAASVAEMAKLQTAQAQAVGDTEVGTETPEFELKSDKKAELLALADRLAQKQAGSGDANPTPVQERLALLAKALDKLDKDPRATTKPTVDAIDSAKATPYQRAADAVARNPLAAGKLLGAPIQTPLQSREWAGEVGQRLVMMVSSRLNNASIQLNPRDLGPIDVKVSLQHEQAHVTFTSHAAPTRDALEQALPKLREMMEQNGLALGDVDVRDQDTRESHRDQQQQQSGGEGGDVAQVSADEGGSDQMVQSALGLVDYYA